MPWTETTTPRYHDRHKLRFLPRDFPPFTTVQDQFYRWRDRSLLALVNEALDRRADFRMAGLLQPPRQGLGNFNRLLRGLAVHRINPPNGPFHRTSLEMSNEPFDS